MKKFYFLAVAAMMGASSMQAQTKVVSLGFEQGDSKYTTATAYTPGGTFGDWVNRAEGDVWTEAYADDTHSGAAAMQMNNDVTPNGNTWDRGFLMGNLQLKENTSYRVSFWAKADASYTNADGNLGTRCIKSSISVGKEYFDMPISTAAGNQYYYNWTNGIFSGEWQRFSYVTFFTNKADQDALSGPYSGKTDSQGNQVSNEGDPFPEAYFLIINMYNPGEYLLDDISVEEGVAFNAATFSTDVVKLDFGYPTNIAELARANGGYLTLDPSCVSVKIDGTEAPVEFFEGMTDGYLYIFLEDGTTMEEGQAITVSFTPAADCPIKYSSDKRPSADVESEMTVLGFQNETAYFDGNIDAIPSAWSPAEMVSSDPENDSFEIESATFTNIAVTYNKALSLSTASATLTKNGQDTDLTSAMSLSEDKKTINIAVSNLADGEYTLTLSGVANSYEVACEGDQVVNFSVGADSDTSTSEVVYSTNETFAATANGTFPVGWLANDNGTIHQYGLTDNGEVWNYNWGGNVGGGGCRAMTGYSGDLNGAAIYWRSMNGDNQLGTLTYGEQVKDYIQSDGTIDPEMPEGISLQLDARKYQITIRMCAWKNLNGNTEAVNEENAPKYDFTLEDLDGNVYASFKDVIAMPNVNGAQDIAVTGVTRSQTDFTVDKAGYYMLKFSTTQPNGEYLLGGVDLITMPSKAAYWKQQLATAVEAAEAVLETAADEAYNGETKTAFAAAINTAKTGHFTSPSEVTAMIDQLGQLGEKMTARVANIDAYNQAIAEASEAYDELEGKYLESEIAVNAKTLLDNYATTNPSDLADDDLAAVTPKIVTAAAQLKNAKDVTDILTWGAYKASLAAEKLGVDASELAALTTDDRAVIDEANTKTTIALYQYLAENNGEIADELKSQGLWDGSMIVVDGEYVATEADAVATDGIDLTGFILNPHFYTYSNNSGANLEDNTIVGWGCQQLENKDEEGNVTSRGSLHFSGDAASEAKPVTDVMINAYGAGGEYIFYQFIPNVPAGIYDIWIGSRTASSTYGDNIFEPFNAVNDETGLWDKYIFAQVGTEADFTEGNQDALTSYTEPFAVGSWGAHPTVIKNVTVKDGQALTIGVCEHYTSGKATKGGEARDFWDTNTFADDARLYFVAPIAGFDYAAAAQKLIDGIEGITADNSASRMPAGVYTISGQRVNTMQRGVNIVKRADGTTAKVLVK